MTLDEMVVDAMSRLNLTSTTAYDRVASGINSVYKVVTSAIGLSTSRLVTTDLVIDAQDPDYADLPVVVVSEMEKVRRIQRIVENASPKRLTRMTYDDLTSVETVDGVPQAWAPKRMGSGEVTIVLDGFPATDEFTLRIDGLELADVLEDDAEPAFPESFHDVLVEGVIADELLKMEKPALAGIAAKKYEDRLSDLRMFIATDAYLDTIQGSNPDTIPLYGRWRR